MKTAGWVLVMFVVGLAGRLAIPGHFEHWRWLMCWWCTIAAWEAWKRAARAWT